jgi:gamma-glutamyltranspeptidase / glutathione hydrolase
MQAWLLLIVFVGCAHRVNIVAQPKHFERSKYEATSQVNMVTSQGEHTTQAAMAMLEQGGNIIDAFVAASFAISVERPHSTGIGGGGFLLFFHRAENKIYAFDFREVAPLRSHARMFLDHQGKSQELLSQEGALAVATPGLIAGLYEIHQRFGKLPWKETIAPAIALARTGLPLYNALHVALEDRKHLLGIDPEARRTFLLSDGSVPQLGTVIIQENLAKTLELIAEKGKDGFYRGRVADAIVKSVRSKNGILSHQDLQTYQVVERQPVAAPYKGLNIYSMPPPSSGGVHVIQILKMLEHHDLKKMGPQSADAVHLTANSMQRAFMDRALYLGDPDFHKIPVSDLLDKKYLQKLSQEINSPYAIKASDLKAIDLPYESPETTHFTIADQEGNLVASTQTINGWFGSGMMAQGTGIILNNEMDDFAQKAGAQNLFGAVGGDKNLPAPRKRPLSSMSPTIILKEGKPFMALGSPSGTRIITCVAQTILNAVEFEMPLFQAVAATRIHQQWQPDQLKIESPFLSKKVEKALAQRGHDIVHDKLGCSIQAIKREKDKKWVGVSDPRGEGRALGN